MSVTTMKSIKRPMPLIKTFRDVVYTTGTFLSERPTRMYMMMKQQNMKITKCLLIMILKLQLKKKLKVS